MNRLLYHPCHEEEIVISSIHNPNQTISLTSILEEIPKKDFTLKQNEDTLKTPKKRRESKCSVCHKIKKSNGKECRKCK